MTHYSTKAVQTGIPRDSQSGIGISADHSIAFHFDSLEQGAEVFASGEGYSYSRVQNPTNHALEARINALEGAEYTVLTASGQAASFTAMLATCMVGDHIVASSSVFGGTSGLLNNVLPNLGIRSSLVENTVQAIQSALTPQTRLIWTEIIGNPACDVPDLGALAQLAHQHGALLVVDNTWAGVGNLCRPFEHGADIIIHSLTKWASGHGNVMGGSVSLRAGVRVDNLPILQTGKPSLLELKGEKALGIKLRAIGNQQIGMVLSPDSSAKIAQGLETLELRLERECQTTLALAQWLEAHPKVKSVAYCGLPSSSWYGLAQKYLKGGYGAVLSFEVENPSDLFKKLELIRIAPNLGDTRTLIVHPWTTTHSRLTDAGKYKSGVTPYLIRLSVGLEALEDLKADLEGAL